MNQEPAAPDRTANGAGPAALPRRKRFRRTRRWLTLALVGYLLLVVTMLAMENQLIYFPSVYPDGIWQPPGLAFEDAWFEAPDGTKLHGWYVPCDDPRAVARPTRPSIASSSGSTPRPPTLASEP